MNKIKSSPTLVATAKNGNKKYWVKHIYQEDSNFYTGSESWSETQDGESKHLIAAPSLCIPKNLGKSNETSSQQQSELEFISDIKLKLDKGYIDTSGEFKDGTARENGYTLPMLAHEYNKRKKSLSWPCSINPKLDGMRALYEPSRGFWSRSGKPIPPEITEHLNLDKYIKFFPSNIVLDGELIMPAPYTFQDTIAHCKKYRADTSSLLEYHIFDLIPLNQLDMPYEQRLDILDNSFLNLFLDNTSINLYNVSSFECNDETEMLSYHSYFIRQGYEGSILRDNKAPYLIGNRSEYLLKYKDFMDEEFTIVDVFDGTGKEQDQAIFVCMTSENKKFEVRPRGTVEQRKHWFLNFRTECLGKKLTVKFQNWTDSKLPRFPVGIAIREEYD